MGFEVEAAHHEVAPGQHEIDFKYSEAVNCADNVNKKGENAFYDTRPSSSSPRWRWATWEGSSSTRRASRR
jgi:hypothetical protein